MKMQLPHGVTFIIDRLAEHGFRADVVGGCVRDFLRGVEPHDYDITTDASPLEMKSVFSDLRTIETGIKHGTLTVLLDSEPYEVTTYRVDGEYTDNRHPDSVRFTRSLCDDLSRRDFTMNAICYNPSIGFTDIFDGRGDISRRTVRAVGDAERRFNEDALRILRALRFASVLDFSIDPSTSAAIYKTKHLLRAVSAERIFEEWKKLIGGVGARRILLEYSEVISVFLPSITDFTPPCGARFDAAEGRIRELMLFALSSDTPGEHYKEAMRALKSDNARRTYGERVLASYRDNIETDTDIGLLLMKNGAECAEGIVKLKILLGLADESRLSRFFDMLASGVAYRISDLAVRGEDILRLGIDPRRVGECLNALLRLVVEGRIKNERTALLDAAKEIACI